VVIVSQPSEISALGMRRIVDFLRLKELPITGLVSMMDGYPCPNCGEVSHQLLSPKPTKRPSPASEVFSFFEHLVTL